MLILLHNFIFVEKFNNIWIKSVRSCYYYDVSWFLFTGIQSIFQGPKILILQSGPRNIFFQ